MHRYENLLREVLQLAGELYFRRAEGKLWEFATALDECLRGLPDRPKTQWSASLDHFLAEQEGRGFIVAPESRWSILNHLAGGRANFETAVQPVRESAARVVASAVTLRSAGSNSKAPTVRPDRPVGRFKTPHRRVRVLSAGEALFYKKLARARQHVAEIERILQAFGQKIDAAKEDEAIEVEEELEAVESLIWQYNDAIESAVDVWLRDDLKGKTFDALVAMSSHWGLGLPQFTDEAQAQRAAAQAKKISQRLDERIAWLDRVIFAMKVLEHTGTAASLLLGGVVVLTVVRQGAKMVVVKTAKVAASAAASYAVGQAIEHGMRAAGFSEETIEAVQYAAEVITWLLLLRRIRGGGNKGISKKQFPKSGTTRPTTTQPAPAAPKPQGTGLVPKAPVALGEWGEIRLRNLFGGRGFKPRRAFKTSRGNRFVDWLVDGVAHESKAGINVRLTRQIRIQALKDAELIARKRIKAAHWHFFQGADNSLLEFLTSVGIKFTVH